MFFCELGPVCLRQDSGLLFHAFLSIFMHTLPLERCWRHYIFRSSVCSMHAFILDCVPKICEHGTNRLGEFHQIYNFGGFGDKDTDFEIKSSKVNAMT